MKKKKRTNRFGYFIREGFSSIFTHGFMSFASVCIIVACLLIMGTFALLALNINGMVAQLEDETQILAFVDESLTEEQARALQPSLESVEHVASVEFVTRAQAMEDFMADYDEALFEGLDETTFRHRYIVHVDDAADTSLVKVSLENIAGIADVNAQEEVARALITVRNVISIVSLVLVLILFVISLFIMSNTIKLATFDRRDEIAIMKMVGATNSFIRWPFVVEGMILGVFGAVVAFLLEWGLYSLFATRLAASTIMSSIMDVIPFGVMALPLAIVFGVVGFVVGIGGSLTAIKNYLKV